MCSLVNLKSLMTDVHLKNGSGDSTSGPGNGGLQKRVVSCKDEQVLLM